MEKREDDLLIEIEVDEAGMKQAMANQLGMSLVEIPCWWDGSLERYKKNIIIANYDKINYKNH